MNETKPGLKTTEFWLALVVTVGGAVASVYAETEIGRVDGIVAATLASAGYGFARSSAKNAAANVRSTTIAVGNTSRTEVN